MSASPLETLDTGKLQATYTGDSSQWDTTPTSGSTRPVTSDGIYKETKLYSTTVSGKGTFYRQGHCVWFYANENLNQGASIGAYQTLTCVSIPSGFQGIAPNSRVDFFIPMQGGIIPGLFMRAYNNNLVWSNLSSSTVTVPTTPYWLLSWATNDAYPSS